MEIQIPFTDDLTDPTSAVYQSTVDEIKSVFEPLFQAFATQNNLIYDGMDVAFSAADGGRKRRSPNAQTEISVSYSKPVEFEENAVDVSAEITTIVENNLPPLLTTTIENANNAIIDQNTQVEISTTTIIGQKFNSLKSMII